MKIVDAVGFYEARKLLGAALYARSGLAHQFYNVDESDKKLAMELINKIDELLITIGKCDIYYS